MSARCERWRPNVAVLHWIGAALVLGLIALGFAMRRLGLPAATAFDLFQQHKSFGFVALAVTLARLGLRAATSAPVSRASGAERALAGAVQASLYVLTLAAIASGWLTASASPIPVPTRVFGLFVVPNLTRPDIGLYNLASLAHAIAAYAILTLVALHAAGALKHHFWERDDTMMRMLGLTPRRGLSRRPS